MAKFTKLSSYSKNYLLDMQLIEAIVSVMQVLRTNFSAEKVYSDSHTHLIESLKSLFGEDEVKLIKDPLAKSRDNLEDFSERIGLDLGSNAAVNYMRQYRSFMMYVHRNLTLKYYIEETRPLKDDQRLKEAEQNAAEVLIHAFNVFINHRDWVNSDLSLVKANATLLYWFIIDTKEYGEDIEGHFGWEALTHIADLNGHLFKVMASSAFSFS